MRFLTRKNLRLIILTLLGLACIIALRYSGQNPNPYYHIGSLKIPSTTVGGVISGSLSLICILIIFVDYNKGFIISLAMNLVSAGNLLFAMTMLWIHTKDLSRSIVSLPGMVTILVSLLTLIIIHYFYKKLSISNMTDYITNQGNRRNYVKEISEHIDARKSFTLACVEVEDFKHISDLYGIQTGDALIKKTAEKLTTILDKKDKLFRITGSTLAILFEPGESPEERLKSVIDSETITIQSNNENEEVPETTLTMSLGAGVVYSHPPYNFTRNASSVLRDAETALARTRNMSEQRICIFNEKMENLDIKQREAEFLVKEALKNNYFYLVYQPQYTTNGKKLRGFETLIRCRKPDGSVVSPAEFIPAAEKTNLIMKIDDYVLKTAMKEFLPYVKNMENDFVLSINISAKTMGSKDFVKKIKKIIEEIDFPTENLELEITEYSFAESMETTIYNIEQLRDMNIHIALDDFGTGYTSIKRLMSLPINILKVDKSLIDDIESSQSMRSLLDSVIYMGHIMNCEVISEGVENESQIALLKEHKCDFIQGFIWGKPQTIEAAVELCKTENPDY